MVSAPVWRPRVAARSSLPVARAVASGCRPDDLTLRAGPIRNASSGFMDRLKKRAQFLAVARGARTARSAFVLQALCVRPDDAPARFGFTVTKKTGNSVERNRIRRRLRAAVEEVGSCARAGCDYVLIGRRDALSAPFSALVRDLASALRKVHDKPSQAASRDNRARRPRARRQGEARPVGASDA